MTKGILRQLRFEGANYFTVYSFLLVLVAVQFLSGNFRIWQQSCGQRGTNSRKQLIEQCSECQKLPDPVHDRLILQLPVQGTAAQYWQQKLVANPQCAAVPLVAQDVISAPA